MNKLYIIDAVNFLFRSYYAIGSMTSPKGESTNALYGFIRTLFKLIRDFSPDHLVCVFDGPDNKHSRRLIYQDYKSHRERAPDDLYAQFDLAIEFCNIAGIPHLEVPNVEADDTMGSVAKWAKAQGADVYLCTGDKDLCQIVDSKIHVLNVHKENLDIGPKKVEELFGVKPGQLVDLLALMGDASDNIPGVEGFGAKTAAALITEFGSLDALLANPEKVKGEKKQHALKEGKEVALLSRRLAQLDLDVQFPKDEDFFHLKQPDIVKVREFYHRFRFLSLLKELGEEAQKKNSLPIDYEIVEDENKLIRLISELSKEKNLVIDTETTHLHPFKAKIVGIGLARKSGEAWYIPCNGKLDKKRALDLLSPLLHSIHIGWIGQNIKYDLHALANEGLSLSHVVFDTMIASYLLSPQNSRHNLDDLCLDHFGKTKIPIESLIGKGQKQISMSEVPIEKVGEYCCEDADYTFRLFELFSNAIKEADLESVMKEIEMPLVPVLFSMERHGIKVDRHQLASVAAKLKIKLALLEEEIFAIAKEPFNLNSPKQLSSILFEKLGIKAPKKTATGFSTNAEVLESLKEESPIIDKILQYRVLEKLRSTYADALIEDIQSDERIHCTFNQSVAATGRLSCQNPNLQNIPVRTEEATAIRRVFTPTHENFLMVSADYSQIELRLLAHYSEDPSLIKAFEDGEDIHASTAALVFGVPLSKVTPEMRTHAKAVNFGILYGQGPFGLSQQIGVPHTEAAIFIELYFARYPKVKEFIEFCKEAVRQTGYAITLFGRKRPIADILSKNTPIRSAAERLAVNTPLQGTAADLIKLAMIDCSAKLRKRPKIGSLLLQIHDELVLEGPKDQIPELSALVKSSMEGVCRLKVPLIVDISIGNNWGEC
jgi:DNA polymerase I